MRPVIRPALCAAVMLVAAAWPAAAGARTIVLGSAMNAPAPDGQRCLATGCTLMQTALAAPGLAAAPEAGTITSWRAIGEGSARLRVLRPQAGGAYRDVASSPAVTLAQEPVDFAVSLPVQAGDRIGVDLDGSATLYTAPTPGARMAFWTPALGDGASSAPSDYPADTELLVQATLTVPDAAPAPAPAPSTAPVGSASAPAPTCHVPELLRHSVRAARRIAARSKRCRLRLVVRGSSRGRVRRQYPKAGTTVAPGTRIVASTRRSR